MYVLISPRFLPSTDTFCVEPIPNNWTSDLARHRPRRPIGILLDTGLIPAARTYNMNCLCSGSSSVLPVCGKMSNGFAENPVFFLGPQSGKVHFSYIYGIGVLGCLAFYALLTVMATQSSVTLGSVVSVLGYCLLPMVVLSGINVLIALQCVCSTSFQFCLAREYYQYIYNIFLHNSRGTFGVVLAGVCILWCSVSASKLFVTAYSMDHQQILVAYPCALLYGVFALITIF